MIPRSVLRFGVAIAVIPLLAACGGGDTTGDRDFSKQYADVVKASDQLRQDDPQTVKAGELRAASEKLQAELDQFQAVSEGPLDTAISTLRANVDVVRQAAADARSDAQAMSRPELEDAMAGINRAWAALQDIATLQCDTS
jgi:hypothetical protein